MKQIVFAVNTPWGKKGDPVPRDANGYCGVFCAKLVACEDYLNFPDLFHAKKTDEESLESWLRKQGNTFKEIAHALVEKGFDVNKIRSEE